MAISTLSQYGDFSFALQSALGAFADESYTNAKKINGTAVVSRSANIDPTTETYIGQTRFMKPYTNQVVNVADASNATDGATQGYESDWLTYIKTVRTHGAKDVNVQRVLSQVDGLAKIGRDFGEVRAQDEHESVMAVLRGVAAAEGTAGAANGGLVDYAANYKTGQNAAGNDIGFYVDTNAAGVFGTAAGTDRTLITDFSVGVTGEGAILGGNLFKALAMGFADYEPEFMYMICSPESLVLLRQAALVDQTTIVEGNLEFQTLFGGKFRLITSRTNQGNQAGLAGVQDASTKTTLLLRPGAIDMQSLSVPLPVELDRAASVHGGSGTTTIWNRWGYVAHPMGYTWTGSQTKFAASGAAASRDVDPGAGLQVGGSGADSNDLTSGANWERKFDMLNLGILPVFHS